MNQRTIVARPMGFTQTKTTYLEMLARPASVIAPPFDHVEVIRKRQPSVERYRQWYRAVGEKYFWVDRLRMPDDELRAILEDELVEIYLLQVDRQAAGYAELDRRTAGEIELAYFGLFDEFVGRGLGKYLLNWILHKAWSHAPRRVWVHTCDLDHLAALPNYLKAGFVIYDEQTINQMIPDETD